MTVSYISCVYQSYLVSGGWWNFFLQVPLRQSGDSDQEQVILIYYINGNVFFWLRLEIYREPKTTYEKLQLMHDYIWLIVIDVLFSLGSEINLGVEWAPWSVDMGRTWQTDVDNDSVP